MVGTIVCLWIVLGIWVLLCLVTSKQIEGAVDVVLSPELLRVARCHQSAEYQAMSEYTEAVLVGGPSCGYSVVITEGKSQWTEVRNGIYYRWDRTERVSNGHAVFQLAAIVPCAARLKAGKAK